MFKWSTPPFPYFLPSLFIKCFAILSLSFIGKVPHLRRWLVAQSSSDSLHLRFSRVILNREANSRRSVYSPQDHFISILIISDRRDWRDTRSKWPLVRNPDRSWWHRHSNWKFFWSQVFFNKAPRLYLLYGISLQKANNEPALCTFCGKMFKTCRNSANLAIHLKTLHHIAYLQFSLKMSIYRYIYSFYTIINDAV